MIVVMKNHAEPAQIEAVVQRVEELGYKVHLSRGEARTIIGVIGADEHLIQNSSFEVMDGVERTMRVMQPYKLASRDFSAASTVIDVNGVQIGGPKIVMMAGPCSVESRSMILEVAHAVKEAGGSVLRGGAFKPRSSPYSFQGLGEEGLKHLAEAREQTGLPIITEVMGSEDIGLVGEYTDIFQVGARNTELLAAQGVGQAEHTGVSQARDQRDCSGAADERRICPVGWQYEGHGLRARHPHLRDSDPQHL